MDWSLLSPFDLSGILLDGGSLLVHTSYQDLLFKITHASSYYWAWPAWVVSVSGSPNSSTWMLEPNS